MELSKRLQTVAHLVSHGMRVADVGTDHGYIPIYLLQTNKVVRAIAMDVNQGPLLRAKKHVEECGLREKIDIRLSDGVQALNPGEVDCVVIAGMGGALTIKILTEGELIFRELKEFVLQPQSEIHKVREFLCTHGYCILAEDMIYEEGKFYPMMKVVNAPSDSYEEIELKFGKYLLKEKHPVLEQFLRIEKQKKEAILAKLALESGSHIEERKNEMKTEWEGICIALQRYFENY